MKKVNLPNRIKTLALFLVTISINMIANSQCSIDYDKFDKTITYKARLDLPLAVNGYTGNTVEGILQVRNINKRNSFNVSFDIKNLKDSKYYDGCFIHFLFEDGSDFEIINSEQNSEMIYYVTIHKTDVYRDIISDKLYSYYKRLFTKLKTQKLQSIRFNNHFTKYDADLTPEKATEIMESFKCLNIIFKE